MTKNELIAENKKQALTGRPFVYGKPYGRQQAFEIKGNEDDGYYLCKGRIHGYVGNIDNIGRVNFHIFSFWMEKKLSKWLSFKNITFVDVDDWGYVKEKESKAEVV